MHEVSRYDVGRYHIHASVYVHTFMIAANIVLNNMSNSSHALQIDNTCQEFETHVFQVF